MSGGRLGAPSRRGRSEDHPPRSWSEILTLRVFGGLGMGPHIMLYRAPGQRRAAARRITLAPMDSAEVTVLRSLYGFNWAATGGRETGLERMAAAVAPDFEAHLSAETGGRVVTGIEDLRQFGYALEQDFAELTYDAEEFRDLPGQRVLVLGRIHGRGRQSSLPLEGEFGHVWTFAEGHPRSIEAFLDRARAVQAVQGRPSPDA
jgi:hypothetical protein